MRLCNYEVLPLFSHSFMIPLRSCLYRHVHFPFNDLRVRSITCLYQFLRSFHSFTLLYSLCMPCKKVVSLRPLILAKVARGYFFILKTTNKNSFCNSQLLWATSWETTAVDWRQLFARLRGESRFWPSSFLFFDFILLSLQRVLLLV